MYYGDAAQNDNACDEYERDNVTKTSEPDTNPETVAIDYQEQKLRHTEHVRRHHP